MEILWKLRDNSGSPITGGAADTSLKIRRGSDGLLYDWHDSTFKAAGWVHLTAPLAEVDAVNLPGAYALTVDVATWLPDTYQLIAVYDGAYRRLGQAEYAKHPLSTWEIGWLIVDGAGQFVTGGAADTEVKVRRGSDGFMLDWDDLVFKATGWTELAPTLQETDAVNAPGLYRRAADVSGWMDGQYQAFARYDDGGLVRDAQGEITAKDGYVEMAGVFVAVPMAGEFAVETQLQQLEVAVDPPEEVQIALECL